MHDTKMNSSHFGRIIINQADGFGIKHALNGKLFANLSFNSVLKFLIAERRSKKRLFSKSKKRLFIIYVIDVSTNANRPFRYQTLLASFLAAHIMKNVFSISDHDIWDNLFEVWIGFSLGARLKAVVLLVKDCRQIAINVGAESLKNAKPLKKRAGKNENIFVCNSHNHLRIPKSGFRSQNLAAIKFPPLFNF